MGKQIRIVLAVFATVSQFTGVLVICAVMVVTADAATPVAADPCHGMASEPVALISAPGCCLESETSGPALRSASFESGYFSAGIVANYDAIPAVAQAVEPATVAFGAVGSPPSQPLLNVFRI